MAVFISRNYKHDSNHICTLGADSGMFFEHEKQHYSGQGFVGIGPAVIGLYRFKGQRQLKWEAGFVSEISHFGKHHSFRLALEFEF